MQKYLIAITGILTIVASIFFMMKMNSHKTIAYNSMSSPIDNMPLIEDDPFAALAHGNAPIEQRDEAYRRWLSTGVKIKVSGASGSGTIIYYNSEDGWAYVQSCGHLWSGNMTAEEGKRKGYTCDIEVWYHNEEKLSTPQKYNAEVLYYSNSRGRDVSLLRFKPDWEPVYLPIAPEDFEFQQDMRLHSVGCDEGKEVAHYNVRVIGFRTAESGWNDLVTTENSPRPGRSGGGLMNDTYFVGVCWGTSSYDGSGNGYFTPLSTIRQYNKQNGYEWLNDVDVSWARMIPIVDRNNPQGKYPPDYIPLPKR